MTAPSGDATMDPTVALAILGAFDDLPIGVSILAFPAPMGGPARRVYANHALADLFGYTLEEIYRAPARLPVAEDEAPRLAAMLTEWMSGGDAAGFVMETAIVTKDGRRVPIEARIGYGRLGAERLVITMVTDISARVAAAAALRTSEDLFRRLAEVAPDSIVISDQGNIVYANPATARILGYASAEELSGLSLSSIIEPDEVPVMVDRMRRRFAGEAIGAREYRGRRKDGSVVTVEISASPLAFGGKPAILAVGRDVDERLRRQAEMIRADRMAAVGALAAGVAHEVNNPLTYVILQLDRLRARLGRAAIDPCDREAADAMLADALDGSQRVAQIVRDLLWFAREDAGGREPVDVREPIDTALKLATSALRLRAAVTRDVGDPPAIAGNAARLTQVFLNLIVNAAQAFDRDAPDLNRVDVAVRAEGGRVIVEVADNGPGIPDAIARRVFEPFFTTKPGGTGLGLAISRSIVEDGGGAITAEPRPGGGTILRVSLPLWSGEGAPAPPAPATSAAPRARVLVVDDDATLARALADALAERHDVTVAGSAAIALDRLEAEEFAVIVCDIAMPGMSGVELARRVVADRPAYRGRFVFITGGAVSSDVGNAIESLACATVAKPFDLAAIDAAIAACLARSSAR